MTTRNTNGEAAQADAGTTIGVGGATSGQQGATPSRETQAETGGSGGAGLTASQEAPATTPPGPTDQATDEAPLAGGVDRGIRGAQDTRPDQGGGTGTGLGLPESGGNQVPEDLPPTR